MQMLSKAAISSLFSEVVGERRSTRAEERVLHFDFNFGALKIFLKESLKLSIKLDVINQIIFDESEPRTVLISCHDEHRYLLDFQNAEENLIFRTAYAALVDNTFDLSKFNRTLLLKGPVAKKSLSKFKDRYLILVPRKLFILSTKTSVYPRSVLSLLDANPRYDETRNTVHLDVLGKEYVFRGDTKEESLEWFVALAHGCGLSPICFDDWGGVYGDAGVQLPQHLGTQSDAAQLTHSQQLILTRQQQLMSLQQQQQQQLYEHPQQQQDIHGFVAGPPSDGGRAGRGTGSIGRSYNPRVMPANAAGSDAGSIQTGASRFTSVGLSVPAAVAANTAATGGDGSGGLGAGGGAGSTYRPAASLMAIRGESTQAKGPRELVPLPGMPTEAPEGVQLRGGHAPSVAPWHSNASAISEVQGTCGGGNASAASAFPTPSGVPGVAMPSHKSSIPPGRFFRSGSLPGPSLVRAGLVRGGRISSMPGPSNLPPSPGLQYLSEGLGLDRSPLVTARISAKPTQAATWGILRDKSNSSPWLTDTGAAATVTLPLAGMAPGPALDPIEPLFTPDAGGSLLAQRPGHGHMASWVPGPAPDPYLQRDIRGGNDESGWEIREMSGEIGEEEYGGLEDGPEPARRPGVRDGDRERGGGGRSHKSRKEERFDIIAESRVRGQHERSASGGCLSEQRYLGVSESSGEQGSCTGLFRHQRRRRNGMYGVDPGDGGDSSSSMSTSRSATPPAAGRKRSGRQTPVPCHADTVLARGDRMVAGGGSSSNGQEPGGCLPVHTGLSLARAQHRSALPTVYEAESGGNTDGELPPGAGRIAMKMTTKTKTKKTSGAWDRFSASPLMTARTQAARKLSAAAPPSPAPVQPRNGHSPESALLPSASSMESMESDQQRRRQRPTPASTAIGVSAATLPPQAAAQEPTSAPSSLRTPGATALLSSIEAILRSLSKDSKVAAAAAERLVDGACSAVDSSPSAPAAAASTAAAAIALRGVGASGTPSSSGCGTRAATTAAAAAAPSWLLENALPAGGGTRRVDSAHPWRPQGPADASHSEVWRGRSEVDNTPCLRPSVVRSHMRDLRTIDSGTLRGPAPEAGGLCETLQGHRRTLQLLQWTQANYQSLLRELRNPDPEIAPLPGRELHGDGFRVNSCSQRWLGGGDGAAAGALDRVGAAQVQWLQARATQPSLRWSPPSRGEQTRHQTQGQQNVLHGQHRRQLQSQSPLSPLPRLPQYPYPYLQRHRQPPPQPMSMAEAPWEVAAPAERSRDVTGSAAARIPAPAVSPDIPRRRQHSGGTGNSSGDVDNTGERCHERSPTPSAPQQQRLRNDRARQRNQWACGCGVGVEWIDSGDMGAGYGEDDRSQDGLRQGGREEWTDGCDGRGRKGCLGTSKVPKAASYGPCARVRDCGAREQAAAAVRSAGTCGGRWRRGGSVNSSDSGSSAERSSASSHSHSKPAADWRGSRRHRAARRRGTSPSMTRRGPTSDTAATAGSVRNPRDEGGRGNRVVRYGLYGGPEYGHSAPSSIGDRIVSGSDDDVSAVEEVHPIENQIDNHKGLRQSLRTRRWAKAKGEGIADADAMERRRSVRPSCHRRRRRPSWESRNRRSSPGRCSPSEPCGRGGVSRRVHLTSHSKGEGSSSCLVPAAPVAERRNPSPPPPPTLGLHDNAPGQRHPDQRYSNGQAHGPRVDPAGGSRCTQALQHHIASVTTSSRFDCGGAASTSGRTGSIGCSRAGAADRVCTQLHWPPIQQSPASNACRRSVSGSSECDSFAISACSGATTASTTDTFQRGGCSGMAAAVASSSSAAAANSCAAGSSVSFSGSSPVRAFRTVDDDVQEMEWPRESNTRRRDQYGQVQQQQRQQVKHNQPQNEGQQRHVHMAGGRQPPAIVDGNGGEIEDSSRTQVVHTRISLSDFSQLAAASAADSDLRMTQSTADVKPAAVTAKAAAVSRRVAKDGRLKASGPMGPGDSAPAPPKSTRMHGKSGDAELWELQQNTSLIPRQGKQPRGSEHASRHSTPTQCSPALSRSCSPPPSIVVMQPEAGDEAPEGLNSSFAFPLPAAWTPLRSTTATEPPLHQHQHQQHDQRQIRPTTSMTGGVKPSPTPPPLVPPPVREPTITLSELLAVLHTHLYGEQTDGSGGAALGNFPSGEVGGLAVQTPAAADTPMAPFGETYKPIHNPLFSPQPEDRDLTGQVPNVVRGSMATRQQPQAQQQQLWWAPQLQQQQQQNKQSVLLTQYAAGYGSDYQAAVSLPQPQDRQLRRPHSQLPLEQIQPGPHYAQEGQLQQQVLSPPQQIYCGMDNNSGGNCYSCQPPRSGGQAVPVASTAMDAVIHSEKELLRLLHMLLQPGQQRPLEEAAEAAAARCSSTPQASTSISARVPAPSSVPSSDAAPTSGLDRRPSISLMTLESSRCIQHAAMVAAEAATSAVSEAMSALSRIGYQATTARTRAPAPSDAMDPFCQSTRHHDTSCNAISSVSSDENIRIDVYQTNSCAEHVSSSSRGGRAIGDRRDRSEAKGIVTVPVRRSQQGSLLGRRSGGDYHQRRTTGPQDSLNAATGTGGAASLRPVSEDSGDNGCGGGNAGASTASHTNRRRTYVHAHPGRVGRRGRHVGAMQGGVGAAPGLDLSSRKWATRSDDGGAGSVASHDEGSSDFGGRGGADDVYIGGSGDAVASGNVGSDAPIDPGSAPPCQTGSLQPLMYPATLGNINTEELLRGLAHGAIQTALRQSLQQQLQQYTSGAAAPPAVAVPQQQPLRQPQQDLG